MSKPFISVDWGTSNFRLHLVDNVSLKVIEEVKSTQGIKATYLLWKESNTDRELFYLTFLSEQINKLNSSLPPDCEVVISGMASSSIGIRELDYAPLPFRLSAKGLTVESINQDYFPFPIYLISGVKNKADVIRGEEVQLIGLSSSIDQDQKSVCILPGTHSKHMYCKNGVVTDFKTYMTGEIFEVIRKHTILAGSIESGPFQEKEKAAFVAGIEAAHADVFLLANLFQIRAWDLFQTKTPTENFYYLSGLLIGSELAALAGSHNYHIYLGVSGELAELYQKAAEILKIKHTMLGEEEMKHAVIKGQWIVLKMMR